MPTVAVFGSSRCTPADPNYNQAVRLGGLLARAGMTVANGGYAGVMEAVSIGARREGGEVIGVTAPAVFPDRSGANLHLTSEIAASSISERIHRLMDVSDASIALSGSLGTVTEFVVAWNEAFVAPMRGATPKPLVAVGAEWGDLVGYLVERFAADPGGLRCVLTVEEALEEVSRALADRGTVNRLNRA